MFTLASIHLYPVKSARGLSCPEVMLDRFGPVGDRRWMLVDPDGQFLSQRQMPALARLDAQPLAGGLSLGLAGECLEVAVPTSAPREVQVWDDTVTAYDAGDKTAQWLSERFQRPLRLVYMPDDEQRRVDTSYAQAGETVSFADGFPLLLLSAASLDQLNARLSIPVGLERFRANLIVEGCTAHAEDDWQRIRIGEVTFTVAKPCSRCTVPSLDQRSGEKHPEILRALASYRRAADRKVYFGQNLLYANPGTLRVGDQVEVL